MLHRKDTYRKPVDRRRADMVIVALQECPLADALRVLVTGREL